MIQIESLTLEYRRDINESLHIQSPSFVRLIQDVAAAIEVAALKAHLSPSDIGRHPPFMQHRKPGHVSVPIALPRPRTIGSLHDA